MVKKTPEIDKWMAVSKLNEGDKVKLTNGDIMEYVRLKQKNFVATMDGKSYNVPVNMFVEVIEKVDMEAKRQEQREEYLTLKKGELFYISHKGNAMLFEFDTIKNGKIIGINPISKGSTKIDSSLYGGKVSSLQGQ